MSTMAARLILPGVLFLVAVVSGVWLTLSGRPLNAAIMAIHKIVAVVTVILTIVAVVRLAKQASIGGLELSVMVVAGLLGLLLFASGAWLSFGKPVPSIVLAIHKVMPLLTPLAGAGAIYLMAAAV